MQQDDEESGVDPRVLPAGPVENTYLLLLLETMQRQLATTASRETIADMERRLDVTLDGLGTRLKSVEETQRQQQEAQQKAAVASMRHILAIQTSVLVSIITTIAGLIVNFAWKLFL